MTLDAFCSILGVSPFQETVAILCVVYAEWMRLPTLIAVAPTNTAALKVILLDTGSDRQRAAKADAMCLTPSVGPH